MRELRSYSKELKAEAVKLCLKQGLTQEEAGHRLGIPKGTIGNWVIAAKSGCRPAVPGAAGDLSVGELASEVKRLRKELEEARMEKEILQKSSLSPSPRSRCEVRGHDQVATPLSGQAPRSRAAGLPRAGSTPG